MVSDVFAGLLLLSSFKYQCIVKVYSEYVNIFLNQSVTETTDLMQKLSLDPKNEGNDASDVAKQVTLANLPTSRCRS